MISPDRKNYDSVHSEIFALIQSIPKESFPQKERLYTLVQRVCDKSDSKYSTTIPFDLSSNNEKIFTKKDNKTRVSESELFSKIKLNSKAFKSDKVFFQNKYDTFQRENSAKKSVFTSLKQKVANSFKNDFTLSHDRYNYTLQKKYVMPKYNIYKSESFNYIYK